jgi:hypothetical protein
MAFEYKFIIKDDGTAVLKNISQNINVLQKNLISVDNSTNIFSKSLSKMQNAFSGWATAAVSGAGAALKDFAKEMVDSYDSAAKLSDNIGVAAESIVGLRYAADLSSVGSENMDKNMAKLAQTISKAAGGSKEASATFAKMGIEVKNSDGTLKNSEQVLMEMADAFQKLPAGTERATLAMDVFGKSGASMVSMLKDGSGALKEMVNEGAGAAGNIKGISESMEELGTAATKGKAAVMGIIASLADTSVFKNAIKYVKDLSEEWIKFVGDRKEMANMERRNAEMAKAGAAADIKRLEAQRLLMLYESSYHELSSQGKMEMKTKAEEEIKAITRKSNLTQKEITYQRALGKIMALNNIESRRGSLKEDEQRMLDRAKATVAMQDAEKEKARIAAENAAKEAAANAAAIAGYGEKQKAMEEASKAAAKAAEEARRLNEQRLKDEAKEFDDLMKKKGMAIEDLAELDEKMRIAGFDGERKKIEQALSDYEKQKQKLEELHELELMFAADDEKFEILATQGERLADLQRQNEAELDKISKEYASKREKNSEALAKFDEETRNKKLSDFALEQSQLEANFEKRRQDMLKLHEEELALAEDKEAAQKAQHDRMLALETAFNEERKAMSRATVVQSATDSLGALQQMAEGYKSYAGLYKASQIGQATINAVQSVLKTMASVPYPFNIPMAALQGAAAAVQVRKIASTKMYTGGIIPGGSQYLRVNEEGPEAILNTGAVRAVGGPAGVNALNRGDSIYHNNNSRTSSINVTFNAAFVDAKGYNDVFKPMLKEHERRL